MISCRFFARRDSTKAETLMKYGSGHESGTADLGFFLYTLASIDCWVLPGAAALPLRTKEENHKRVAGAPLLRFSPFEIPFPYLPPGSLHVGKNYRISASCPTRGGSVW